MHFLKNLLFGGFQSLLRKPGFSTVSILVLSLGLASTTILFTVVNSVVLRPLPFRNPDQLVMIWESSASREQLKNEASMANFLDWRGLNQVFSSIGGFGYTSANLTGEGVPERVSSARITADLFPTLGIAPFLGRYFTLEDEESGAETVILSYRLWQQRYGGNPSILEQPVTINATAHRVIAVMPSDFQFPDSEVALWFPYQMTPERSTDRQFRYLNVFGRLKPDVSLETARSQMGDVARRLEEAYPDTNGDWGVQMAPLHEEAVGDVRPALLILMGTAAFVLLIACANVANLLLVRSTERDREMAVRRALGANRLTLAGQLFSENLVLCLMSAGVGLLMVYGGLRFLATSNIDDIPRLDQIGIDFPVLGFILAITFVITLALGAIPAFRANSSRLALHDRLKQGIRGTSQGPRSNRLRSFLVVTETALTVLLLIGAGLMVKSLLKLQQIDPGFNPDRVLAMEMNLPRAKYPNPEAIQSFFDELLPRLEATADIEHAGLVTSLPLSGDNMTIGFQVPGQEVTETRAIPEISFQSITPNYFKAMEIPLVKGRFFNASDRKESPRVAIVNRAVADRYWPQGDAVGGRLRVLDDPEYECEIVGVVGNVKHWGLEAGINPELYLPHSQSTYRWVNLVASTRLDPLLAIPVVRDTVTSIDPEQPVFNIRTARQVYADSIARSRFYAWLLTIFASVALVLATVGIYGVIAYSAAQRTREIGVRMALGAKARDVLKLVVGRGVGLVLTGTVLGLVAAIAFSRVLAGLLYGVTTTDAAIFIVVPFSMATVAVLASFLPARRAARIDPVIALRME